MVIDMGYSLEQMSFFTTCIGKSKFALDGKKMVELGNQHIKLCAKIHYNIKNKVAKDYFLSLGVVEHLSLDKNGRDGALSVDLGKPLAKQLPTGHNHFDILTNVGTSEHVEPIGRQYECFRNMHYLVRPGGIFIHIVPKWFNWKYHCLIRYEKGFFSWLAKKNNYEIIELSTIDGKKPNFKSIGVCMRKNKNNNFISVEKWNGSKIFVSKIGRVVGKKKGTLLSDENYW